MTVPEHLRDAANRLEAAQQRIELARAAPESAQSARAWLEALTDCVDALSELHRFSNESVHEKLHQLAAGLRVPEQAPGTPH